MSETVQPPSTRVCANCRRPLRALDPGEYTDERASLVIAHGLCVCAGPTRPGDSQEPELTTR